jgi:hypothetical protein
MFIATDLDASPTYIPSAATNDLPIRQDHTNSNHASGQTAFSTITGRQSPTQASQPRPIQSPTSSLDVGLPLNEGPLTPRNDAGPFVFDGAVRQEAGDLTLGIRSRPS